MQDVSELTMDVVSVVEAEHFIQAIRPFVPTEVGSSDWKDQRIRVEQLNHASHYCAQQKKDDFVLNALVQHSKLPVLLHELIVAESMRKRVYSKLGVPLMKSPAGMYMYAYYESIIVNLLSCVMFHEEAVLAFEDDLPELIEYCWRSCIQTLLTARDINEIKDSDPKKDMALPEEERFGKQLRELDISRALSCISCLWFIIDRVKSLSLAAVNCILNKNDLLCGVAQLLDAEPWMRRGPAVVQKFRNGSWVEVSRSDALMICTPEAHCWFALHTLMSDRLCRQQYEYNQYKKDVVLRVKRRINETIVDQIPALVDVQRALEELSFMEPPSGTEEKFKSKLLIEQVPRIMAAIEQGMVGAERSFTDALMAKDAMAADAMRISRLIDAMMGDRS